MNPSDSDTKMPRDLWRVEPLLCPWAVKPYLTPSGLADCWGIVSVGFIRQVTG